MKNGIIFWFIAGLTTTAQAAWQLDNAHSQLHFISVKSNKVGEVNTFQKLEGAINDAGEVTLKIDLTSVDTKVQIRDERLQKFFFEVDQFPQAELTAKLDLSIVEALKVGEVLEQTVNATLILHGVAKELEAQVVVVQLTDSLLVASRSPIILNTEDFQLVKGVEKLAELAKLEAISYAVPVGFSLRFTQEK